MYLLLLLTSRRVLARGNGWSETNVADAQNRHERLARQKSFRSSRLSRACRGTESSEHTKISTGSLLGESLAKVSARVHSRAARPLNEK